MPVEYAPVIFIPAGFGLFWCGMCFMLSRLGPWKSLACIYSANVFPTGARMMRFQNVRMGMSQYNGCMNIAISSRGLYMVPMFVFKFGHQPVLIPWSAFRSVKKEKVLFMEYGELILSKPSAMRIQVPGKVLNDIQKHRYIQVKSAAEF